jgi:2-C-methyl-D-erythritol 2,4-cyclodiphosphate synthase
VTVAGAGQDPGVAQRIGLGQDRHPFGPGEPLRLAGLEIPGAPRLHGHSDGDVVLHAVAGALLGGAAQGDLGGLAPADARTPLGVSSRTLVLAAAERVASAGWRPASIDVTITAGRPRLIDFVEAMREAVAQLLGLDPDRVSLKLSTGNLQGPEGEGRAISASAVAVLVPVPPPSERRP